MRHLRPACIWFLKVDPVRIVGMRVCVCVCVSTPEAILITSMCRSPQLVRPGVTWTLCVGGNNLFRIIFHLIISYFYLLYHNITSCSYKSKNHPSTFVCYLLSVNGILFLPWGIVVRPKPDQLDHLLWPDSAIAVVTRSYFLACELGALPAVLYGYSWKYYLIYHKVWLLGTFTFNFWQHGFKLTGSLSTFKTH